MGGSLAIVGAAALADAVAAHPDDPQAADGYEAALRPYIEEVQAHAVDFGLKMFFPRPPDELRARDEQLAAWAGT